MDMRIRMQGNGPLALRREIYFVRHVHWGAGFCVQLLLSGICRRTGVPMWTCLWVVATVASCRVLGGLVGRDSGQVGRFCGKSLMVKGLEPMLGR